MLLKSLRLGSPELSITTGRLATGILPPWPSLAGEHSWAPTGGLEVSGASAGSQGRTKRGQAAGVNHRPEAPPPLPEARSLHSQLLAGSWGSGPLAWFGCHETEAALRVDLCSQSQFLCLPTLCFFFFFNVKNYSRLDLVKPEITNQVLRVTGCWRVTDS